LRRAALFTAQDIDTMLEKAETENPALGRMAAMG
jgi:hypothetical protein